MSVESVEKRMQPQAGRAPNNSGRASLKRYVPYRKVSAGTLAGALSIILVWIANAFLLSGDQTLPGEVASAVTTILTFVVGYMVPEG